MLWHGLVEPPCLFYSVHALYLLRPSSLLVKQTQVKQKERERHFTFFTSKADARKADGRSK